MPTAEKVPATAVSAKAPLVDWAVRVLGIDVMGGDVRGEELCLWRCDWERGEDAALYGGGSSGGGRLRNIRVLRSRCPWFGCWRLSVRDE